MDKRVEKLANNLKRLEDMKIEFAAMKEQVNQNPEEFLRQLGYSNESKKISSEEIQGKLKVISDNLSTQAMNLQDSILNSDNNDSKKIEDYYKKIQSQGGKITPEDVEKMLSFFSKYIQSETENVGQSCFHYDFDNCDSTIIDAHSLQKKGTLKVIASEKHEVIFIEKNELKNIREPKRIKTKNASTFKGFCHKHDSIFQQTIEASLFNNSEEHCFLHSYRAFAYSHHIIKQNQDYLTSVTGNLELVLSNMLNSLSDLSSILGGNMKLPVPSLEGMKLNDEQKKILSTTKYESYKELINTSLENENYDDLDYIVYSKNHKIPIACSSWIKSHLHFGEGLLIQHKGELYHGYPIMVTIIPESNDCTHIILARFKSDSISKILFDQLKELNTNNISQFELTLSSIVLRFVENLYISPKWWDSLDTYLKAIFIDEMNLWESNFMKLEPSSNVINLFDEVYKL